MNVNEIKVIAKERGIVAGKMKKGELIRAIQEKEGNPCCFATDQADRCGQTNCLWRGDCV